MKLVVMLGPSPHARGGMASVIATLLAHGYADDGRCRFIATHVEGGALRKAARAGAALTEFVALLAAGRVALLHVHVASGTSFWRKAVFIGAARAFGCPVLFHLHGGQFCQFIDQRLSGPRQRAALALIGGAAAAFALTDESAHWLRTRCQLARVEVFPNPVATRAALPRVPGSNVVFIGRLEEKKGVFDLLHAFARVAAASGAARLVLAGEGERDAVLALASELGILARLSLPGWVDAAQKAHLLATAAVFVLPSHHEQMPMSLLEALAAGAPVVASNAGAIPRIVHHEHCGFVIPAKDIGALAAAILRILEDNVLADSFSRCGRERVASDYRVETVLVRLRRRYEELAA